MKAGTIILFILMIIIGSILAYGLVGFYGIDLSNQITAAATAAANVTP